jgi:hypothetical protein
MITRNRLLFLALFGLIITSCNMPLSDDDIEATLGITPKPPVETSSFLPAHISGRVWHDLCASPSDDQEIPEELPEGCIAAGGKFQADGKYTLNEPGIKEIIVSLGKGSCPSTGFANSSTNPEGVFTFVNIEPGRYCVSVDPTSAQNASILLPGAWTSDLGAGSSLLATTVNLSSVEDHAALAFGWDYDLLPPYNEDPSASPDAPTMPPTAEITETLEPTETPLPIDPTLPTWDADYVDLMINPGNWFAAGESTQEDEHIRFEIADSRMKMTAFNPDLYEGWRLSWPDIEDFYLDAGFEVDDCSGGDRYGLFVRATNIEDNPNGYLFGVNCEGQYSLRTFDGEFSFLIEWSDSEHIQAGSHQSNLLGFWAKGEQLRLYVNGNRVAEIEDETFASGPFGLFVGASDTEEFRVEVDFMSYWVLP